MAKPPYRRQQNPSSWRRLATATWRAPNDSTVYGTIDVDITAGLDLIESAILDAAGWREPMPSQFLARERHVLALESALDHVRRFGRVTIWLGDLVQLGHPSNRGRRAGRYRAGDDRRR